MDVVYTCLSISIDSPPLYFCFFIFVLWFDFLYGSSYRTARALICVPFSNEWRKKKQKMDETMCPGKTKTKRKEKGVVQNGRLSATRSPGQFFFCVFQLMTLFSSMSIYTRWWYSKPLWSLKNKKICWNPGDDKPPTSLRIKNKKKLSWKRESYSHGRLFLLFTCVARFISLFGHQGFAIFFISHQDELIYFS